MFATKLIITKRQFKHIYILSDDVLHVMDNTITVLYVKSDFIDDPTSIQVMPYLHQSVWFTLTIANSYYL